MKHLFKHMLVISVATVLSNQAYAGAADADMRLEELSNQINDLKLEVVDLRAKQKMVSDNGSSASSTGFMVGDTSFKIGGYVDLDVNTTQFSDGSVASKSAGRDFYFPNGTPIGGAKTQSTDFTAETSRLNFTATRDVNGTKVVGFLDFDLFGSAQGNERVTNSFSPRLRRAYIDFNNIRVGQEWTTFFNLYAFPESASFLAVSDGMIFMRQPQIRYTTGNFQFALENGNTTVAIKDEAGSTGSVEADSNMFPDAVVSYNLSGDYGKVSIAGILRELRYETAGGIDEKDMGFALSLSGRLNVSEKDDIRFGLAGGDGLGRYIGLNTGNGAAFNPATGGLEAISSYGGFVAYRHPFGETARVNLGVGYLSIDNPDFVSAASTKSTQSAYAAVLWDIAPKVTMGVELLKGVKELENGDDGSITRATFSTQFSF